jgi:hypothetical protein
MPDPERNAMQWIDLKERHPQIGQLVVVLAVGDRTDVKVITFGLDS